MSEFLLRFVIGGIVVSTFAVLGEVFRPKSFAGIFAAAPSIALATIGLTVAHQGKLYAAVEARSMLLGAVAFFCYASAASWILMRYKPRPLLLTLALLPLWLGGSLGLDLLFSQ
jgi:hypothetical protein